MLRRKNAASRPSQAEKKSNKLDVLRMCLKIVWLLTLLFKGINKCWDAFKSLFDDLL